jgi:hypothetical protein
MKIRSSASAAAIAADATYGHNGVREFTGADVPESRLLSPLEAEREVLRLYQEVSLACFAT